MMRNTQQERDLLRELDARRLGPEASAAAAAQAPAGQRSLNVVSAVGSGSQVIFGVLTFR